MYHSGLTLRGSISPRAIRDRDLHHVHAFSDQLVDVAEFFGSGHRILIRGLKEFGDTSRKALIIGYSDPGKRGQMVGTYYLVRDLIVSTGAILGAYLWKLGPALNFLGAAAIGAAGTIFYIRTTRRSRQLALSDLKKAVGDAAKSLELATTVLYPEFEIPRLRSE